MTTTSTTLMLEALRPFIERLLQHAQSDPNLSTHLEVLGKALVQVVHPELPPSSREPVPQVAPAPISTPAPRWAVAQAPTPPPVIQPAPVVTLAPPPPGVTVECKPRVVVPAPPAEPADVTKLRIGCQAQKDARPLVSDDTGLREVRGPRVADDELLEVRRRCEVKAKLAMRVAAWLPHRETPLHKDPQAASLLSQLPQDERDRVLGLANDPDATPGAWETYADTSQLLADVLIALGGRLRLDGDQAELQTWAPVLAEAQSMLRCANRALGGDTEDFDQFRLFQWLRHMTHDCRVFVKRYMREDDVANPAQAQSVRDRVAPLLQEVTREQLDKELSKLVKKVSFHVKRIVTGKGEQDDWDRIDETVGLLISHGMPASNAKLREAILPVADVLADHLEPSDALERVLQAVDRYLATRPPAEAVNDPPEEADSDDVLRVRERLGGKVVTLIGGTAYPYVQERLVRHLGLSELRWVETDPHDSEPHFDRHAGAEDVSLVLVGLRWLSHPFSDAARRSAESFGKPCVLLRGGLSHNRVAHEIVIQASKKLGL